MRGSLPWQGVKISDKKLKYQEIYQKKIEWGFEKLSEEHNIPKEFSEYMKQVRKLEFE